MSSAGHKTIVALLISALLPGCAGNGNGLDSNGNPLEPGGGPSGPLTADFQSIQAHVFTPICTRCHIGAGAPQGLQLDAAHSYSLLVGVPSSEQPNVLRVQPGDPDSSYIVRKLQGSPGITGEQMPLGGPYLPQATIDVIRQWISDGAPQGTPASLESAVKAVQRFTVTMASPDDQSIASAAVPRIVVEFNSDLDPNLLNATTVAVSRLTGADAAIPVAVSISVPEGNPAAVLIQPQAPLGNGTYRVELHGSLAGMNAQALGSDYSFTFTVDALQ